MKIFEKDSPLKMQRIETRPFGTNAYVLICQNTRESVFVDAPGEPNRILAALSNTHPRYILITHSHFDHTGALEELKSRLRVPVAAHNADAQRLPLPPDINLEDGESITFGKVELKVLHTPGHTPGSLCFLSGIHLFSGDTLFPGGPGRTNAPSDLKRIITSLEEKIFILPDDTLIYPGHGEATVLKKEKEKYAIFAARSHPPDLYGDILWDSS